MILANLAKAIREQNYYAVFLEFVIVIAGVVIGFQVTSWSEQSALRAREESVLAALRQEIEIAASEYENAAGARMFRINNLTQALEVIGNESADEMPALNCHELRLSHTPWSTNIQLQTLEELAATGSISLISDVSLRQALINFRANQAAMENAAIETQRGMIEIPLSFPELVQLQPNSGAWAGASTHCNLASMRASQAFQNALVSNIQRNIRFHDLTTGSIADLEATRQHVAVPTAE